MKRLAHAILFSLALTAPAALPDAAQAGKPAAQKKPSRRDKRKATAALIKAVPKTRVRERLVGGTAFVAALRAEQTRLESTRRGPDGVAPTLQAEIRQRVLGLDRLLARREPDYFLNVPTHQEVARIRDTLRALLD